ncbi:MAG: hypothetical protein WA056_14480 [Gallionella sp.]
MLARKEPALEPLPPASLLPQERVLLLAWLLLAWLLLAWLLPAWLLQLSSRLALPSSLPAWLLPF